MERPSTLQEWVEALERGKKVPLCPRESPWLAFGLPAFLGLSLPLLLLVEGDGPSPGLGWLALSLAWWVLLTPTALVLLWTYRLGENSAVQLGTEGLGHWDQRGREQWVPWSEMTSLRIGLWAPRGHVCFVIRYAHSDRPGKLKLFLNNPPVPVRLGWVWSPSRFAIPRAFGPIIAARAGLVATRRPWRGLTWERPASDTPAQ